MPTSTILHQVLLHLPFLSHLVVTDPVPPSPVPRPPPILHSGVAAVGITLTQLGTHIVLCSSVSLSSPVNLTEKGCSFLPSFPSLFYRLSQIHSNNHIFISSHQYTSSTHQQITTPPHVRSGNTLHFLHAVNLRSVKHDACCGCFLGLQLLTLFLTRDSVHAEQPAY